jgi:hypothetical protein
MITVAVLINNKPLYTRSAVRIKGKGRGDVCTYRSDTGDTITHVYDEGAVELAIKLLSTIEDHGAPADGEGR